MPLSLRLFNGLFVGVYSGFVLEIYGLDIIVMAKTVAIKSGYRCVIEFIVHFKMRCACDTCAKLNM